MGKINVLNKSVAELIAAGEVIERPASIVKELVENSIDSGANIITVEIKNGGKTYIRITDNGCGMSDDDVPLAFLRHATSKISSKEDLDNIMTLGFRGEALASISAVSKVEVLTKVRESALGFHYCINGSEEVLRESTGCPDGTTIIIRDIFYNVPARLKFLKKDVTEGNAIASIIQKIAVSHPEISFKFIRDNKIELLTAGDGKLYSSVYSVIGREFASSLIPVNYSIEGISVTGYTVKPLFSKSNRSFQSFYINGRYVKSVTCMVAIEEAYKNSIMTGKFPACVLNIEIPPNMIDVNVHPSKTEVRFSNEKLIYDAVYFAVKNALLVNDITTEMVFNDNEPKHRVNKDEITVSRNEFFSGTQTRLPFNTSAKDEAKLDTENISDNTAIKFNETEYFSSTESDGYSEAPEFMSVDNSASAVKKVGFIDNEADENDEAESGDENDFKFLKPDSFLKKADERCDNRSDKTEQPLKVIGEVFKTYIIVQSGNDMFLIDKHAAHERYIFEQIKSDAKSLDTQMCIEPVMVMLSFEEYDAISANLEDAAALGFCIEPDVAPNVYVTGVPNILADINPSDVIPELASDFLSKKHNPSIDIIDQLYHSIACKAAIKANDNSDLAELDKLVSLVIDNDNIKYCPHGRPVMIKISRKDIEKQFKRIV